MLDGSRSDALRLQQRLRQLLTPGRAETTSRGVEHRALAALDELPRRTAAPSSAARRRPAAAARSTGDWIALVQQPGRHGACRACPTARPAPASWPHALMQLSQRVAEAGATPQLVQRGRRSCASARAACWRTASTCSTNWASCASN